MTSCNDQPLPCSQSVQHWPRPRRRSRSREGPEGQLDAASAQVYSCGSNHALVFAFLSVPIDTPTLSPFSSCPSLTASRTTASETRAPPRSPPSSRRRRSNNWSAPPSQSVRFSVNALDTKANTSALPSVSESEHVPFPNTHSFALARRKPFRTRSQTHTHTRTRTPFPISPHPRNAALHRPPRGPRPRPPVGRVGRAFSRAHLTPPATSPPQLAVQ